MSRSRLLALTLVFCLVGATVSASERISPPVPPAPAVDGLPQPLPPQPLALDLTPQTAPTAGYAAEFAQRLAVDGRLSAADRADRVALKQFYDARNNEPLWVTPTGLSSAAAAALAEIGRADEWGLEAAAFRVPQVTSGTELTREQLADAEIAVSLAILKYARHARGGRAEPLSISRNLDRKAQLLDPRSIIEAVAGAAKPDAYLRSLHPQHPQFERLRQLYLAAKRGQPAEPEEAVAQRGRKPPAAPSLRLLLVNMEQWRWMPANLGSFHVWVNIPEFTVRVIKAGALVHSERIIVGRTNTQTPVFSDEMEQVIFHPFWGVPDSIKQKELLPSLARGSTGVLERHNLRVQYRGRDIDPGSVDWSNANMRHFHVYQPPGGSNVLGVVKFRFPNKHDVYMHDTPTKGLFNAAVRTFSHGCMRVRDPVRLAQIVLAEDRGWPASRVAAAVRSGPKDNQINLTMKVPVHMTYFTAWVEDDGKLHTFADIYGHDPRIAAAISAKSPSGDRQADNPAVSQREKSIRRARVSAGKRDDRRRVFDD